MGLFVLRDIISDSVLLGLNVTQVSAHSKILTRSALRRSAEETGSSTIINMLVSSTSKRIHFFSIYDVIYKY